MDPRRDVCLGCGRTLDEIARWASMPDDERDTIMAALPTRRARLGLSQANLEAKGRGV